MDKIFQAYEESNERYDSEKYKSTLSFGYLKSV